MTTIKELKELDANGLLPCPFCGGKPTETSKVIYSMIECCGTRIIDVSFSSCQKKWNTRNALPDLIRVIEIAKDALDLSRRIIDRNAPDRLPDAYNIVKAADEINQALSEIRKLEGE